MQRGGAEGEPTLPVLDENRTAFAFGEVVPVIDVEFEHDKCFPR